MYHVPGGNRLEKAGLGAPTHPLTNSALSTSTASIRKTPVGHSDSPSRSSLHLFLFPYLLFLCTKAALFIYSLHSRPPCSRSEQRSTLEEARAAQDIVQPFGDTPVPGALFCQCRHAAHLPWGTSGLGTLIAPPVTGPKLGAVRTQACGTVIFLCHSLDLLRFPKPHRTSSIHGSSRAHVCLSH